MERADFQPLLTTKRDTPALNLSPRALPHHHISGRVKVKIAPMTSRPRTVRPTIAGMLPVATYGHSPTDKLPIDKRTTMPSRSEVTALRKREIPTEPPTQPIPPKPPHVDRYITTTTRQVFPDRKKTQQTLATRARNIPYTRQKEKRGGKQQDRSNSSHDISLFADDTILLKPSSEIFLSATEVQPDFEQDFGIDCGSPLIWTMLHPASDTWRPTYAWNQPLAEYMPMTACPLLQSKPELISLALWNNRRHFDPSAEDIPRTTRRGNMKASDLDRQNEPTGTHLGRITIVPKQLQHKIASTPVQLKSPENGIPGKSECDGLKVTTTWTQPTENPIAQLAVSREAPSSHYAQPQSNQLHDLRSASPCQPHPYQSKAVGDVPSPLAMVVFLIVSSPGGLKLVALLLKMASARFKQWYNKCPLPEVKPVKTRTSCNRWIAAIIQRLWNTAWDLLAHRNVDSMCLQGSACPFVPGGLVSRTFNSALSPAIPGPCFHQHLTTIIGWDLRHVSLVSIRSNDNQ